MIKQTQPQVVQQAVQKSDITERLIAANNQRALEMLLRIQSQVIANTVSTITPHREINYE